ncbi:MAG: NADH-quinone oxidoreductase subunit NuoI [Acidimicrobiales bacterium]
MGVLDPIKGFKVTLSQVFQPRVTTQYPEEKRPKPPRFHGRHVLNRYEDGMEKCIGCELCAGVCPARCIYVRGKDNPPDAPVSPGERYGFVYEINFLRCIHCDLCVEACPTEAITESKLFEFSFTNREDAVYTRAELVVSDDGRPKVLPWEDWREGDDLMTSGWMRATSPSGAARFEGERQWSGELGYGERRPEVGQSAGAGGAAEAAAGGAGAGGAGGYSVREQQAYHLPGLVGFMARRRAKRSGVKPGGLLPFAPPDPRPNQIKGALRPPLPQGLVAKMLDMVNAGPVRFGSGTGSGEAGAGGDEGSWPDRGAGGGGAGGGGAGGDGAGGDGAGGDGGEEGGR